MADRKKTGSGVQAVFGRPAINAASQHTSNTLTQQSSDAGRQNIAMAGEKVKPVKATYYIAPNLIKPLKFLSVELDRDLSGLVTEAIGDLLAKYRTGGR